MNLAKAFLVLRRPMSVVYSRVVHGLVYNASTAPSAFEKEQIVVRNGLFRTLYEVDTGCGIQDKQSLDVVKLLGYCTDIESQLAIAQIGCAMIIPVMVCEVADAGNKQAWLLLAIPGAGYGFKSTTLAGKIGVEYEQVLLRMDRSSEIFGIPKSAFQNLEPWPGT
jgi:hypothetical protein